MFRDDAPRPGHQCQYGDCEQRAVDPSASVALCEEHLEGITKSNRNDTVEEAENTSEFRRQESRTTDGGDVDSEDIGHSGVGTDDNVDEHRFDTHAVETDVYPTDLRDVDHWLTWQPEPDGRKVLRAPYETGDDTFVSAQDPEMLTSFDTAREWVDSLPGYGLAFTIPPREEYPDDPFVLVDYDDARDPATGEIHPTVREHIERADSYADVSTSGTGVHIFCRGTLPDGVKSVDASLPDTEGFPDAEIEVYDTRRHSAMTGAHIAGTPTETCPAQAFLDDFAEKFATVAKGTPDKLTREPE